MNGIIIKTSVVCKIEKYNDSFYNKYRECKKCNIKRVLKRYYNNKDNIIQKSRDKFACFIDWDNRLKALEEKLRVNINLT